MIDYEHVAGALEQISDAIQDLYEEDPKEQSFNRILARRLARALRRTLVRMVGHVPVLDTAHCQRCIDIYLSYCKEIRVQAPLVRVPRRIQTRYGKTIGGQPVSPWDNSSQNVVGLYSAMSNIKKDGEDDRTSEASSSG